MAVSFDTIVKILGGKQKLAMLKFTFYFFLCFVGLFTSSAKADSITQALEITKETCRALLKDEQRLSADYQAGVDVYGNAVVGADLVPSAIQLPEVLTFPVTLDLAQRYDLPAGIGAEAILGELTFKNNRLYWQGQALGDGEKDQVRDQCREALSEE